MSGVAAILALDGAPASGELMAAMLERLHRRGPDARASWREGPVALGHCLLATTPEDGIAAQPLRGSDGRRCIVADARIDNRTELLDLLELRGRSPEISDAELILAAYERWGEACPGKLIGDFVFIIWDGENRELVCARDHFGVRTLYYSRDARRFRCASEIQALFADAEVPRKLHRPSLSLFLVEEYLERDQTLYEGIFALPPAHTLVVTPRSFRVAPYWAPNPWREVRHRTDAGYAEDFRRVFTEAVRCRLRSRGPVTVPVSGGLDSSSVAGQAAQLQQRGQAFGEPPRLVRATFPGLACDEAPFSQAVADRWQLPIETAIVSGLPDPFLLEPANPGSYYHPIAAVWERMFTICRRNGGRTVLTGLGSDEMLSPTGHECEDALRRGELAVAARAAGLGSARPRGRSLARLLRVGTRLLLPEPVKRAVRRRRDRGADPGWPAWLTPLAARDIEAQRAQRRLAMPTRPYPDGTRRAICESLTHGHEVIFGFASLGRWASAGIDLRHPFFDLRLIELLLSFPPEQRSRTDLSKPVLRRAMHGVLPQAVRDRVNHTEFSCFVEDVLFHHHGDAIHRLFEESRLEACGMVTSAEVLRLFEGARRGERSLREVTTVLALELWLKHSIG